MGEATARPWVRDVGSPTISHGVLIDGPDGKYAIVEVHTDDDVSQEEAEANAELIVQAVNSHEALVAEVFTLRGRAERMRGVLEFYSIAPSMRLDIRGDSETREFHGRVLLEDGFKARKLLGDIAEEEGNSD